MKASETNILKFIGGLDKVFIIPPFQRNYEWSFEQCDELFEDIISSYKSKKTHYLGNIVYYEGKNNGASFSEFILVDGQQRVTTILLLLCAIRDEMKRQNIPDENITIRYLENDNGGDLYRVRLKQTSYDADSFNMVVKGLVKENDKKNNIIKNYFHFISLLRESSIPLKDIYNTITKLEVVDVNLQIEDNLEAVQTVFEKINSTGKRLSPADLIRNCLLLSNSIEEQELLYKNYWIKIERTVSNENISRFARDFLVMKIFEDVEQEKIYKKFKDDYVNQPEITHVEILDEMSRYAKYFAYFKFENCENEKINKLIIMLNLLKTDDLMPLYLCLFDKLYINKPRELEKILEYHNNLYYNNDAPEISDMEYDKLLRELEDLEKQFPEYKSETSPTMHVGGKASEKFSAVTHKVAMESLQDVFSKEELYEFDERIRENLKIYKKEKDIKEIVNISINNNLKRTLYTSISTLFAIFPLVFSTVDSLKGFSAVVMFGIIIGTYSSIFIASLLLTYKHKLLE